MAIIIMSVDSYHMSTATKRMTAFHAGDEGLRIEGRTGPIERKEGHLAYKVIYKKGQIHPKGANTNCTFAPEAFFPSEACRFSFKIFYDEKFPWGPEMSKVGGKIIGFKIGTGDASGGNYSTTGATYRLTWAINGGVGPYLYPQVRNNYSRQHNNDTNIDWSLLDQSAGVRKVGYVAAGIHMFYPKNKKDPACWDLKLRRGEWNDVEMFCKLNNPGKHDGILEITVNGVSKAINTVRYRNDKATINSVQLSTFFGGGTKVYAPPHDATAWYADFAFSKT